MPPVLFTPRPDSALGLKLALRQDLRGASTGGLDALFADDPLSRRMGGMDAGRWAMEAGYGLSAFRGRFTGTPHLAWGASAFGREIGVGWRLEPQAGPGATEPSLAVLATRRESDREPPEHGVGVELRMRW